ncbi:TetR family transcriptional regulator [Paraburkholderia sp. BL18I3N2]|nr:TetR family transcriptional regulator [Paraburkholderia sp. BL18I3N2]
MTLSRKEQSVVTREAVLDSAEHLFSKNGVSKTTLEKIAQHANVTRGAIYFHFRNKNELFAAMLDRAWQPVHESLSNCTKHEDVSVMCALREAVVTAIGTLRSDSRNRQVTDILLNKSEFIDENARVIHCVRSNAQLAISNIRQALQHGVQRGELSTALDVNVIAQLIHAQLSGTVHDVLRYPYLSPVDSCICAIEALFLLIGEKYSMYLADASPQYSCT